MMGRPVQLPDSALIPSVESIFCKVHTLYAGGLFLKPRVGGNPILPVVAGLLEWRRAEYA